jgi:hypothetical protein
MLWGSILGVLGLCGPVGIAMILILPDRQMKQELFSQIFNFIGTAGYVNVEQTGENPFGIYTHLGFEYYFNKWFGIMAACQSDMIFRKSFTTNSAFSLEIGIRF